MDTLISKISEIVRGNILLNESLKDYTSFKIGGYAKSVISPSSIDELHLVMKCLLEHNLKYGEDYVIIGGGTNILVPDEGIDKHVIHISKSISKLEIIDEAKYRNSVIGDKVLVSVEAGAMLSDLAREFQILGLKGFEFASGIPGSIGGALFMNAGAYGGEMKHIVKSAQVIHKFAEIVSYDVDFMELGYRKSVMQKTGDIIVKVYLELEKGDKEEIESLICELTAKRTSKQPLEYPSAGSVFKRPPDNFAGKLIENAGLKGYRIGGAQVSEKHSGFIVNVGNATADDVKSLITHIQDVVEKDSGIRLEREIIFY